MSALRTFCDRLEHRLTEMRSCRVPLNAGRDLPNGVRRMVDLPFVAAASSRRK